MSANARSRRCRGINSWQWHQWSSMPGMADLAGYREDCGERQRATRGQSDGTGDRIRHKKSTCEVWIVGEARRAYNKATEACQNICARGDFLACASIRLPCVHFHTFHRLRPFRSLL